MDNIKIPTAFIQLINNMLIYGNHTGLEKVSNAVYNQNGDLLVNITHPDQPEIMHLSPYRVLRLLSHTTHVAMTPQTTRTTQTRKQHNMENEQQPPTPMTKEQQSIWLRYLRNQVTANALRLATIIVLPATAFSIANNTDTPPTLPVAIATAAGLILASRISF